MAEEIWKSIPEYPYHEASNLGRIRSKERIVPRLGRGGVINDMLIKSRIMMLHPLQGKTARKPTAITLRLKHKSGKWKTNYVHQVILFAFVGHKPEAMECRHLDGNPFNNRLDNLKWGTPKENRADAIRHGTHCNPAVRCGEDNARSKLTNKQIIEIVYSPWGRRGIGSALAKRFGVGNSAIYEVRRRYRERPDLLKTIEESTTCLINLGT